MESSLDQSKHEALFERIRQMPGDSYPEKIKAYEVLVKHRLADLEPQTEEWHALIRMVGYLTGGVCRFERDFPIEFLPQAPA